MFILSYLKSVQTLDFIVLTFISVQSLMATEFEMGFHICAFCLICQEFFLLYRCFGLRGLARDRPYKCVMVLKGYHDFVTTVRAPFSR